jgi:hypothetical protein
LQSGSRSSHGKTWLKQTVPSNSRCSSADGTAVINQHHTDHGPARAEDCLAWRMAYSFPVNITAIAAIGLPAAICARRTQSGAGIQARERQLRQRHADGSTRHSWLISTAENEHHE